MVFQIFGSSKINSFYVTAKIIFYSNIFFINDLNLVYDTHKKLDRIILSLSKFGMEFHYAPCNKLSILPMH